MNISKVLSLVNGNVWPKATTKCWHNNIEYRPRHYLVKHVRSKTLEIRSQRLCEACSVLIYSLADFIDSCVHLTWTTKTRDKPKINIMNGFTHFVESHSLGRFLINGRMTSLNNIHQLLPFPSFLMHYSLRKSAKRWVCHYSSFQIVSQNRTKSKIVQRKGCSWVEMRRNFYFCVDFSKNLIRSYLPLVACTSNALTAIVLPIWLSPSMYIKLPHDIKFNHFNSVVLSLCFSRHWYRSKFCGHEICLFLVNDCCLLRCVCVWIWTELVAFLLNHISYFFYAWPLFESVVYLSNRFAK